MNRKILRLAIPNVISNITIPVLGMINIAVAGRMGSDAAIGGIAVGAAIFGFIYWNCGFIRMGTSGLTAQALGARHLHECVNILVRSFVFSLAIAVLLLVFRVPILRFSISVMDGSDEVMSVVKEYFLARIWAAPATVSIYAVQGWFIGMQNSRTPMYVAVFMNIINIALCILFVFRLGMGAAGIGWATAVTQYAGLASYAAIWFIYYKRFIKYINWKESLRLKLMFNFFNVNKDIFLRNVCNVTVYTFFTVASSYFGDTLLATNTILIQLFTFFSYMADGFGYAAEAITGRLYGAGNFASLRKFFGLIFYWGTGIALLFVLIYRLFWRQIIGVFTESEAILNCAGEYIVWIMLVPLVGFAPFLMDGIMVGATKTKIMRNSMFFSTLIFFALYYSLLGILGNNALWLAFIVFLSSRGILQYFMSDKLKIMFVK